METPGHKFNRIRNEKSANKHAKIFKENLANSRSKALEKAKGGKKVEIGKLHRKINNLNPAALDSRQKNRKYNPG